MITSSEETPPSSCGLYTPPYMRAGYVQTKFPLNNGPSKFKNHYSEVNNNNEKNQKTSQIQPYNNVKFSKKKYVDRQFKGTALEYNKKLDKSTTLYIGQLNLSTSELAIRVIFSNAGNIKNVIMGLKKKTFAPAGFCFIEYETRAEAEKCITTMQGVLIDEKNILIDWDAGFVEGRQYERINRNQHAKNRFSKCCKEELKKKEADVIQKEIEK